MTNQRLGGLDPAAIIETMRTAVAAAAGETLPRFRTAITVDNKFTVGFDPVTEADRAAERVIRAVIAARFPDHAIIGEELAAKPGSKRFEWIIDPIDGTRAFICGVPVWGTLIGFKVDGRAVAGLMAQPFTDETYLGLVGGARYSRGARETSLATSTVKELARAKMSATSPDLFTSPDVAPAWAALRQKVLHTRYGLDCTAYCLLAAGHIDLVVEADLKPVDIAPLIPIVTGAGGIVTTFDGGPAEDGGNCVAAATPELHEAAMAAIAGARR